jgi:hypothetical protein
MNDAIQINNQFLFIIKSLIIILIQSENHTKKKISFFHLLFRKTEIKINFILEKAVHINTII